MKKIYYNRLKEVLTEKSISNKILARQLGISEQTVSRWCSNKHQPSVEMLYRIAEHLDTNVRYLLIATVWEKYP